MTSLAKCPTHGLWRKSASILLIGPGKHGRPSVLTVKRSAKASFLPNNLVFPGGLCEPADFSLSWLDTFPELSRFRVNPEAVYPDIFSNDSPSPPKELSPHVGFRLSAIRELVEEAGLMLDSKSGVVHTIADDVRRQIHEKPERFCEIIKQMDMVPNIWALHDWSTWLTPHGLKHSDRRYDTHFYVIILDSLENLKPSSDNVEVSDVKFWDISEMLGAILSRKVKVAPPQLYELSRLYNFDSVDELRTYTEMRDQLGTERLFPVNIHCTDGVFRVLPGDSLYPNTPDYVGADPAIKIDSTIVECMHSYPHHHRIVGLQGSFPVLHVNIELNLKQMPPALASSDVKSQL